MPFLGGGGTGHIGSKQKVQLKIKVRFIVKQQTLHIHQTGRLKRKGVRNKQELRPNLQTNSYGTAKVHTLNLLECFHRLYNLSLKSVQKHGQPGQISTEAPIWSDGETLMLRTICTKIENVKKNTNRFSVCVEKPISASMLRLHLFCSSGHVFMSTC